VKELPRIDVPPFLTQSNKIALNPSLYEIACLFSLSYIADPLLMKAFS
jgi:hypothetical protein